MEVNGVSINDLIAFKDHIVDRQKQDFDDFLDVFIGLDTIPDHWGMFTKDGVPIFMVGLVSYETGKYDSFTFFSKECKYIHLPFIVKFVKSYMRLLQYDTIIHAVVSEDVPMNKLIKMLGFVELEKNENKTVYQRLKLWE